MRDLLHKSIDIYQVNKFMTANSLAEQNRLFEQLPMHGKTEGSANVSHKLDIEL
jgi:hypothetical protein